MITPVLLNGSEVWQYDSSVLLDCSYSTLNKYMGEKTTPSYVIYGELGLTPVYVLIM